MKTRRAIVSFKTVGCRLNQAETALMRAAFIEAGYDLVAFGQSCDVCVINGCVVTARAEEDSLRLARSIKRRYSDAFVVLAGCAAELQKGLPTDANLLAGQAAKFNLPQIIAQGGRDVQNQMPVTPRFTTQRALVKIQDGCDFNCSYCIVPKVRGAARSRPGAEIIAEISRLAAGGFPEVVLTGANIGCYADGDCRLAQLLEKVEAIPGLRRFRISSLEISTTEREIIDFMAASKKMCRALHLPLQSGSDRILKAMGRRYTAAQYCAVVEYAGQKLGAVGLGTDIIVGFPGETEEAFAETEQIVRRLPFTKLHVFSYSPRPGTPAFAMSARISAKDRDRRVGRLIELGRQKRNEFARQFVGKQVSLLVEKIKPDGWAEGWTGEYLRGRVRTTALKPKQITEFICERVENDVLFASASLLA